MMIRSPPATTTRTWKRPSAAPATSSAPCWIPASKNSAVTEPRHPARRILRLPLQPQCSAAAQEDPMSKSHDQKRDQKKKPAKTAKEKKTEKREKKQQKPFAPV